MEELFWRQLKIDCALYLMGYLWPEETVRIQAETRNVY